MSEYQYYEFVAVDRPLDEQQMAALRASSTRAEITPVSFTNTYHWGSFRGNPRAMMERYFDAHLYLANWGTRQVMLRLPGHLLDLETAQRYCYGDSAEAWASRGNVILDLSSEEEPEWDEDGEGLLASIIPVRAELAAGDPRALYLAWLLAAQSGDLDDEEIEPPVPPNLATLTASLRGLADFLRIDEDLIEVAAEASEEQTVGRDADTETRLASWITDLPTPEKDALLLRVARGEDAHLRTELLRRFNGRTATAAVDQDGNRSVGELLYAAEMRRAEREKLAAQQRDQERARHERAVAEARERRLDDLARDVEGAWRRVEMLIDTKKPSEYDTAVRLLADLRDLDCRDGRDDSFAPRLLGLRERHARKPSLIARLDKSSL